MIKDFSSWLEYEGASEGSGRSEKIWLRNPDNHDIGLFKFPKSKHTTEHISEKIAADIAELISIDCMKVDLGKYNSREGSLSHRINKSGINLIEGVRLINKYYPNYDPDSLYDGKKQEYYSLEMILNSLEEYTFQKEFFKILIFDFLIGNTDRHQNNWAILQGGESARLCPLYDNGSSLCCYILESKLDGYLGNDKVRFQSLVDTKSKSRIRIDKNNAREPRHLEMLEHLKCNYYSDIIDIVKTVAYNLNIVSIDSVLKPYSFVISEKREALIKKFLMEKVNLMKKKFNL